MLLKYNLLLNFKVSHFLQIPYENGIGYYPKIEFTKTTVVTIWLSKKTWQRINESRQLDYQQRNSAYRATQETVKMI